MSDEQAKAVQEVAKTSGKLIDAAEKVGGFVSKVIGGASTQVGGILEDWAKYYRYKNLLAIADKVEALHAGRGLEGKTIPIPPRAAIPMLESASLEDDEVLQEVWALLIANSTDPNFKEAIHPGYTEVIKQLSSDEAMILQSFRKIESYPILFSIHVSHDPNRIPVSKLPPLPYQGTSKSFSEFCIKLPLKRPQDIRAFFDNLQRLQIIEQGQNPSSHLKSSVSAIGYRLISEWEEYIRITTFGEGLIAACVNEIN